MLRRARDEPPALRSLYTRGMPRVLAIVATAVALSGCGLKGDLYLPPEPPPSVAPAGAPEEDEAGVAPADSATADGDGDARRQVPPTPDRSQSQ